MPDYLGLGDHHAFHPYPLNVTNAHAGVDIILPARALAKQKGYRVGAKLFVSGYSEGGGIAMAQLRQLEKFNDANYFVEAAAPASGPYDLSGATREFMMRENTDQTGFGVRLYLMAYMSYYFHKHAGIKLTDYFKPAMALTVSQAFKTNRTDKDVITRLVVAATLMRAKNSVFNIITPKFEKAMRTKDRRDPLVKAMIENDVFDWSPKTRLLLINLEGDGVVDPSNTDKAFRTMRNRGVSPNTLRRYIIPGGILTHITAVPAALSAARRFFDGGFGAVRDSQ